MGKRPHNVAREAWLDVLCFISELGQYAYKICPSLIRFVHKNGFLLYPLCAACFLNLKKSIDLTVSLFFFFFKVSYIIQAQGKEHVVILERNE